MKYKILPKLPGVYLMRDTSGNILYIGKAKNLYKRVSNYFYKRPESKINILLSGVKKIDYIITSSEREALILENKLIKKYQPKYNILWRDDKTYPYIQVTLNESYPRIFLTRRIPAADTKSATQVNNSYNAQYYGPYPYTGTVRRLLRWLKRIFPIRTCRTLPKQPCLYYYLNECLAPCTGKITEKEYYNVVKKVLLFLDGKYDNLKKILQKEMKIASKKLLFEQAARLRDTIRAIDRMFERVTFSEIKEKDIAERIKLSQALTELKEKLSLPIIPITIEAFDVSNISGTAAVGSMVTFYQGKPDKTNYRRYKIKTVTKIDDYAMLCEVILRRYERLLSEGKKLPELILIDGGKGQLNRVNEVIRKVLPTKQTTVIALAKRQEKIFTTTNPQPVILPKESQALRLLQHIRDEAHRFALSYHRYRRTKLLTTVSMGLAILCCTLYNCYAKWGKILLKNGNILIGDICYYHSDGYHNTCKANICLKLRNGYITINSNEINRITYFQETKTRKSSQPQRLSYSVASGKIAGQEIRYQKKVPPITTLNKCYNSFYDQQQEVLFDNLITYYAYKNGVSAALIKAIIKVESNFNPRAISRKNARGLMQIMPKTAKMLSIIDLYDPKKNLAAGITHLCWLIQKYKGDTVKALAAYNAGCGNIKRYNGIPPYKETQSFLQQVKKYYESYKTQSSIFSFVDNTGHIYFFNEK